MSGETECLAGEVRREDETELLSEESIKPSELEMMKARFSKLLLGEDMSGGRRGVSTALTLSNAITNLAATVFEKLWKLESLAEVKKLMWKREIDWLLSVCDHIFEVTAESESNSEGTTSEDVLESFKETEFWYEDQGMISEDANDSGSVMPLPQSRAQKWWLPVPRVPSSGLSEDAREKLEHQRERTNQMLNAAMLVNSTILSEMKVPEIYHRSLPKNGKDCLGDPICRYITAGQFFPNSILDRLDLSSEYGVLEIVNRIEAAIYVWRRKLIAKKENRNSSWGIVKEFMGDAENRELYAERAESLLLVLKHRFPALPQTSLDISKIQHNKDVGQAILESYSRVLESLAFNIVARIDDLIYVDNASKH